MKEELLKAVELALAGEWDSAHGIVQQYETDRTAAWLHAVLHKMEGDRGNSLYWYRRAGGTTKPEQEPNSELHEIRAVLTGTA